LVVIIGGMKKETHSQHIHRHVKENYQKTLHRIARSAESAGRDPNEIKLVVVTKGHPFELVEAVIEAGARFLGENYVEEARPKIEASSTFSVVDWHMIGHIQSRKARDVVEYFDYVHSLDSIKLAKRLNRFSEAAETVMPVLLELNVSGEESKYGWSVWDEEKFQQFLHQVDQIMELKNLDIRGLMMMAPFLDNPEDARPYFKQLQRMQAILMKEYPQVDWTELSMGMSSDFEIAIQEGATMVRIGTAILGERT
jgi:pyridoxal phosphate enzyme (YggS family)